MHNRDTATVNETTAENMLPYTTTNLRTAYKDALTRMAKMGIFIGRGGRCRLVALYSLWSVGVVYLRGRPAASRWSRPLHTHTTYIDTHKKTHQRRPHHHHHHPTPIIIIITIIIFFCEKERECIIFILTIDYN